MASRAKQCCPLFTSLLLHKMAPPPLLGAPGGRVYVIFSVCDVTNPGSSSLESLPAVCCSPYKANSVKYNFSLCIEL